ncbi:hypothetical protein FHS48_000893 [Novispirillum itersonii]|uniref:Uncharacterized protein n=1 Tax=Novispirillum itersonii TaxID=189 RepID=A0A7X0DL05_NOVIT|nr:hypothetical protein [Novispirillum itersonii]
MPPGSLPPDWNPYTGPYHHDDGPGGSTTGKGRHPEGAHAGDGHRDHGDGHGPDHHHGQGRGSDHGHKPPQGVAVAGRRGLRQRVRRRLHPFRSAIKGFAIGLTLGLIGLGGALATGMLDPQPILQALSGGEDPAAGVQDDVGREVITACAATLARTDCGCFWGQTRAVWTRGNVSEVMQALTERNRYAGQITRLKLDRLIGEDANRQVMQALIQCLQ